MPKKRIPTDIRSIAREHTKVAMDALKEIAANPKAPESARVSASSALLDRGYGKPAQMQILAGDEDGGPIRMESTLFDKIAATERAPITDQDEDTVH